MIYFDTSYVLKRYLPEAGHAHVRTLLNHRGSAACCVFGRLEFISGLRRASREGRLPAAAIVTVMTVLDMDDRAGIWTWLPLTPRLVEATFQALQALPSPVAIRAADALHLVCARESGCQQVFTIDRHMLATAPHLGIAAVNVIP